MRRENKRSREPDKGSPDMTSTVRVVVPNYNYARFLLTCVESVLSQEDVDVLVLIIDDASSDDSPRVAERLAGKDQRVQFRRHTENQGHLKTFNEGLEWAIGATYAVVLDADDALTPGALRRACELLDAHQELGFVYGRPLVFHGDGPLPRAPNRSPRWKTWRGSEWFEIRCRRAQNCVASPEVVMRTSVLRKAGGFQEDLPHTADFELWMRLALHAGVGYIAGPHQAYYRKHSAGMWCRLFSTDLADLTHVHKAFETIFQHHAASIQGRDRLEKMVKRMLARHALRSACRALECGPSKLAEASGLEALAVAAYSDVTDLPEWRSLSWRKMVGPQLSRMAHPFLVMSQGLRLARQVNRFRLRSTGL